MKQTPESTMTEKKMRDFKKKVREAVANYMWSEGCHCCENVSEHKEHKATLGKLLRVPMYDDGSGYDFGKFKSKNKT